MCNKRQGYADPEAPDLGLYRIPGGEFYLNRCATLLNMYLMATYGEGQYVDCLLYTSSNGRSREIFLLSQSLPFVAASFFGDADKGGGNKGERLGDVYKRQGWRSGSGRIPRRGCGTGRDRELPDQHIP